MDHGARACVITRAAHVDADRATNSTLACAPSASQLHHNRQITPNIETRMQAPLNIVNLSEWNPDWHWLEPSIKSALPLHWAHASTQSTVFGKWRPQSPRYARVAAAWAAATMLRSRRSMLVSHGPRMTMYGALALRARFMATHHLAYSFNFTALPHGRSRKLMAAAFQRVTRFVCYSNLERRLYADHFDLDIQRIDMIHWAARPPALSVEPVNPTGSADYICAIGTQGRDYATLMHAIRRLPRIRLVVVASEAALDGCQIPDNVEVHCNIPITSANNILRGSKFAIVPLNGPNVACGHVTIVNAMHCTKAVIVSDSAGIADYVENGITGLRVPVHDDVAMSQAIERLWSDTALSTNLAAAAKTFAEQFCSEDAPA